MRKVAKRTKGKELSTVESSPAAKTKDEPKIGKDHRPLLITGSIGGVVVATDRAAESWKASQIAASWRDSGLTTSIVGKTTHEDCV